MSAENLDLYWPFRDIALLVSKESEAVKFTIEDGMNKLELDLDRNQAHLLFLFLQEHLQS